MNPIYLKKFTYTYSCMGELHIEKVPYYLEYKVRKANFKEDLLNLLYGDY